MIRIQVFDLPGGGTRRVYENRVPVGALRGSDGTNTDRASNQLVQFCLRKISAKNPSIMPRGPGKFSVVLLDGKVGPQTLEGITRFQSFAQRSGIPLFGDSRVSVATGINVPGSEKRWTIHALNSFLVTALGQSGFDNLFKNPEINAEAPELANELALEEARLALQNTL